MADPVVRLLTSADIPAAAQCLARSFCNTVLSPEEIAECRQVKDLAERAQEISRRLARATNGKITELVHVGNPPAVLMCITPQELEPNFAAAVASSVSRGLAVGIDDPHSKQLVAVNLAQLFDPADYLAHQEDLTGRPVAYKMVVSIKRKFAQAFLTDPRFSRFRNMPVLYRDVAGVARTQRGASAALAMGAKVTEIIKELGVGLSFSICSNPISHHLSKKEQNTAELALSESFVEFLDDGKRPLALIRFRSVFEGADNMMLLTWRPEASFPKL